MDSGSKVLDMIKESIFILIDLSISVNGLMIRSMVMGIILTKMATNI